MYSLESVTLCSNHHPAELQREEEGLFNSADAVGWQFGQESAGRAHLCSIWSELGSIVHLQSGGKVSQGPACPGRSQSPDVD